MIKNIRLQNFRSYKDASFEFGPGVNIIIGPNASGKTNLLEAVLVLSVGDSFRVKDKELVKIGADWLRLDAQTSKEHRTTKLDTKVQQKTFEINNKKLSRLGPGTYLPVVLFEPNHLRLLYGESERRRDFIDGIAKQTQPGTKTLIAQYKRSLAQRNRLLKSPATNKAKIFPWDVRMSQLAGKIVKHRKIIVEKINKEIGKTYGNITNNQSEVSLLYKNTWPLDQYETKLLERLEEGLETDMQRGFTSAGPHREDLAVYINGSPAQEVASRGEMRSIVLAMKVLEAKILETQLGRRPAILLDDVFSELDSTRRRSLIDHLGSHQVFITTTEADVVVNDFAKTCNILRLG